MFSCSASLLIVCFSVPRTTQPLGLQKSHSWRNLYLYSIYAKIIVEYLSILIVPCSFFLKQMQTLIENIFLPPNKIADFCRRWKINEFALFGSVLRNDFGPSSDLDVLVTFAPEADWSLFDHVRMQEELNHLLHRKIDLLSRQAVEQSHNEPRRREILNTAQVIYVA